MTVLICKTCPRYDRRASGQFASISAAALDDPGKARVRFTALGVDDAPAVFLASRSYDPPATAPE